MSKWPAIVMNESESGRVQQRSEDDLPEGDVTVAASTGRPETRGRVVIDVHG
jgi:hypothetical protein